MSDSATIDRNQVVRAGLMDLRAELRKANAALNPQLRGLQDLMHVSISDALKAQVQLGITTYSRRHDLITDVLNAITVLEEAVNALVADGYPTLTPIDLSPALWRELQGQSSDIDSGIAVFELAPATSIEIRLGDPVTKTSP